MRYREITESPLGDFAVYGDKENEGSFAASDMKVFSNTKWLKKVRSHFSRTPFNFNVYLYNAPEGKFFPYRTLSANVIDRETSTRDIQRYYRGKLSHDEQLRFNQIIAHEIPNDSNAITIILTDNEGDEKVPLTPWILAHRVAHAVLQDPRSGFTAGETFSFSMRQTIDALSRLLTAVARHGPFSQLLKFRSAREEKVIRRGEYLVELFTQYIVQGKISINQPPMPNFPNFERPENHIDAYARAGQADVYDVMVKVLTDEARLMTERSDDRELRNRDELKSIMAAMMSISRDELEKRLNREIFLENYFALGDYVSAVQDIRELSRRVQQANETITDFLDKECVGGVFVLGAPRS